ncbi:hypothetical protein BC830DRAFT_1104639 [Chytriomyces sp. MP71]|nr:hypothetical protein BC830DRAFT_1104639 [Chytriomyces sp. MP71]
MSARKPIDVEDLLRDLENSLNDFGVANGEPPVNQATVSASQHLARTVEAVQVGAGGQGISGFLNMAGVDGSSLVKRFVALGEDAVYIFASNEPSERSLDSIVLAPGTVVNNAGPLGFEIVEAGSKKIWQIGAHDSYTSCDSLHATTVATKATWHNMIRSMVPTTPMPGSLPSIAAATEDDGDAYDFLDTYGEDDQTVNKAPSQPPPLITPRHTSLAMKDIPLPQQVLYSQFHPTTTTAAAAAAATLSLLPPTPTAPISYAAFQTPPQRFQPPVVAGLGPRSPSQTSFPLAYNAGARRGSVASTATDTRSLAPSESTTAAAGGGVSDEVVALREQLERAKRELEEQASVNRVLRMQREGSVGSGSPVASASVGGVSVEERSMSKKSVGAPQAKDKSDTASISSQKSSKSTKSAAGGGWMFGRSKSNSRRDKKPMMAELLM